MVERQQRLIGWRAGAIDHDQWPAVEDEPALVYPHHDDKVGLRWAGVIPHHHKSPVIWYDASGTERGVFCHRVALAVAGRRQRC